MIQKLIIQDLKVYYELINFSKQWLLFLTLTITLLKKPEGNNDFPQYYTIYISLVQLVVQYFVPCYELVGS